MMQLAAGHTRIRYSVKGQYKRNQQQIEVVVVMLNTFKEEGSIITCLKAMSYLQVNALSSKQATKVHKCCEGLA